MNSWPLGDLPLETFLSEYWQKKPFLIRQALPSLSPPLAGDELAGLACEENVESRLVTQNAASESWDLIHGPFTEETFKNLPKTHWTLLVQAVDHWVPNAAQLLAQFSFIPNWRVDDLMISYSSDQGGVGPHYDNYDVFLVQASGRRQWEVGGCCDENSPCRPDTPEKILTEWEAEERWVLEPGDLLYVPPRVGHSGVAIGDDCMTCSVGFRAPSHGEILRDFADYVGLMLSDERRYADPDLIPQSNPGCMTSMVVEKVHGILSHYVNDKALLADWFGRYMTTPKYKETEEDDVSCTVEELRARLAHGEALNRNEGSRFIFQEQGNEIWLFVDGSRYRCSRAQSEFISKLCAERMWDGSTSGISGEDLQLLLDLVNCGSLYFSQEETMGS